MAFSFLPTAWASLDYAGHLYFRNKSNFSPEHYEKIFEELVKSKLYFSSIPWLKKYLETVQRTKLARRIDLLIDEVVEEIGFKEFSVFSLPSLERTNSQSLFYLRAKKNFKKGNSQRALLDLERIVEDHPLYPHAQFLKASILTITGEQEDAITAYQRCRTIADMAFKVERDTFKKNNFLFIRDNCAMGIARAHYASKNYNQAQKQYETLSKNSLIWPIILKEEAWNYYYLKDYNRSLGKLVTYKSPLFTQFFMPEVSLLRALNYQALCLSSDVTKEVNEFYSTYTAAEKEIKKFTREMGKDYGLYLEIAQKADKTKGSRNRILDKILKSTVSEFAYKDLWIIYKKAVEELKTLNSMTDTSFNRILRLSMKRVVTLQKVIIGDYVRKRVIDHYVTLYKTIQDMGYIRLQSLANQRKELLAEDNKKRDRGDKVYIKRSANQYLWTFNGEFWVEELGDYVFALKNQCRGV